VRPSEAHLALAKLIDELIRLGEAGWPPESILYRISTEGHVARAGRPGHKILARDIHKDARKVQAAFNALDLADKIIVITKHRPIPEGYEKWGEKEMAHYLNEPSKSIFASKYRKIVRKVAKKVDK